MNLSKVFVKQVDNTLDKGQWIYLDKSMDLDSLRFYSLLFKLSSTEEWHCLGDLNNLFNDLEFSFNPIEIAQRLFLYRYISIENNINQLELVIYHNQISIKQLIGFNIAYTRLVTECPLTDFNDQLYANQISEETLYIERNATNGSTFGDGEKRTNGNKIGGLDPVNNVDKFESFGVINDDTLKNSLGVITDNSQGNNSGVTTGNSQGNNSGVTTDNSQGNNSGVTTGNSQGNNSGVTTGNSQRNNSGVTTGNSQRNNSGVITDNSQGNNSGVTTGNSQGNNSGVTNSNKIDGLNPVNTVYKEVGDSNPVNNVDKFESLGSVINDNKVEGLDSVTNGNKIGGLDSVTNGNKIGGLDSVNSVNKDNHKKRTNDSTSFGDGLAVTNGDTLENNLKNISLNISEIEECDGFSDGSALDKNFVSNDHIYTTTVKGTSKLNSSGSSFNTTTTTTKPNILKTFVDYSNKQNLVPFSSAHFSSSSASAESSADTNPQLSPSKIIHYSNEQLDWIDVPDHKNDHKYFYNAFKQARLNLEQAQNVLNVIAHKHRSKEPIKHLPRFLATIINAAKGGTLYPTWEQSIRTDVDGADRMNDHRVELRNHHITYQQLIDSGQKEVAEQYLINHSLVWNDGRIFKNV